MSVIKNKIENCNIMERLWARRKGKHNIDCHC